MGKQSLLLLSMVLGLLSCDPSSPGDPGSTLSEPSFAAADGNENKFVFPVHIERPERCPDGTELNLVVDGYIQGRFFPQANNRNVQLTVYHNTWTFTNTAGETFVFREVGPDHVYMRDGKLYVSVIGRMPFGPVGHLIFDLATGDLVFEAGRDFGEVVLQACEALS